jgi:hypothetical protein
MTSPTVADSARRRVRHADGDLLGGLTGEQGHFDADFLIQIEDQHLDVRPVTGCVNFETVSSGIERG